ncbi:insulinase family protein [Undibacterium sp. CY18W]|uniref:Insulinase family protein n=1 Tax=Undibacterium hunanense TaxID=2762292 RepID=A0ABR6ZL67_9BURK|nr:pitrilysin family protein [Undibacterium hunanense]MBC3916618.1 insulinase family protein [Undibacterium hunanense]
MHSARSGIQLSLKPVLRALVMSGVFLFTAPLALADSLPKGVSQVSSVEGITEYRLPNGLRVLLMPDATKPTVTVNITYLVGSRHENYGETGMAHLLEHMLFKGTPNNPKITEEFNKRGMRMNGTTSLDRTNYYELFQSSDDNLKWALELEADRMVNSFIAKKDLDTEMSVVRNEYERGENSPGGVLMKRLQSVAYDWHNYGNSTIGNRSDIENVKIENLQAFYRNYYQPDNAVLMVAGKFEQEKVLQWINASFGKIAKPTRSLPQFWTVEPTQDGERSVVVRRKGDIQLVMIAYKVPAGLHNDRDALGFANSILTAAPHGRLHKQLVETGKVVQVFSSSLGQVEPGINIIGAVVKKGESLEAARDALLAGIEDFKNNPPTKDELERQKRDNANYYEKLLNNHESIGISMSEYIAMGDWRYLFKDRDDGDNVSAEQVTTAAKRYLVRDNRTVGMFIPEDNPQRAEVPTAPSMAEVMKDFKPKAATLTGEAFDPAPANIDKRTQLSTMGNLQLALLPKKTRGETVNVSLSLHWGDEKSLFKKGTISGFAGSLLTTGTSKYSRAQLSDEMSKLKMSGGLYSFQTTRANLPAALELVAHVLKEANYPESEFKQALERTLVALESSRNEPNAVASRAMGLHFNSYPKGDMRAAVTLDEALAELRTVKLDDIKAFHKDFYGVSKGELSIVGDFDVDSTKQVISKAFDGWTSKAPYTRMVAKRSDVEVVRKTFNTPDKESAIYLSRINLTMREDDADYPALRVANYIFGGAGLNSRLLERIRQKEGLSYGGGSGLSVGEIDPVGSFSINATAAPQNLEKLEASIKDELNRALKDGFTAEELAKAKSGMLQQRVQARTNDGTLAAGWNGNLYLKRNWGWSQAMDDKIQALPLQQVNDAFRRYIDPAKMSIFIAGDEAKAKAAATSTTTTTAK